MDMVQLAKGLDAGAVRAFVTAARHVIDALMIEATRLEQVRTPGVRDYATAELSREAPGGGWIASDELRATTQKLTEAIAAEKWVEGFVVAVRLLSALGGA